MENNKIIALFVGVLIIGVLMPVGLTALANATTMISTPTVTQPKLQLIDTITGTSCCIYEGAYDDTRNLFYGLADNDNKINIIDIQCASANCINGSGDNDTETASNKIVNSINLDPAKFGIVGGASNGTDALGYTEVYPTANDNHEYYMKNTNSQTVLEDNGNMGGFPTGMTSNLDGSWRIPSTSTPRFFVNNGTFTNWEVTYKAKVISAGTGTMIQTYGNGEGHHEAYPDNWEGSANKIRWHFDGRVGSIKELYHTSSNQFANSGYTNERGIVASGCGSMIGHYVGLKAISYNIDNDTHRKFEYYIDCNDTGNFVKVGEFTDNGDWRVADESLFNSYISYMQANYPLDVPQIPRTGNTVTANQVITWAGGYVSFRSDHTTYDFRDISVREINYTGTFAGGTYQCIENCYPSVGYFQGIDIDTSGHRLFVGNYANQYIEVIPLATNGLSENMNVNRQVWNVSAIQPDCCRSLSFDTDNSYLRLEGFNNTSSNLDLLTLDTDGNFVNDIVNSNHWINIQIQTDPLVDRYYYSFSNGSGGYLAIRNTSNDNLVKYVVLNGFLSDHSIDYGTNRVLVINNTGAFILNTDTEVFTPIANATDMNTGFFAQCDNSQHICYDAIDGNRIRAFDMVNARVIDTIDGTGSNNNDASLAIDHNSHKLIVANYNDQTVKIYKINSVVVSGGGSASIGNVFPMIGVVGLGAILIGMVFYVRGNR